ncbi:aldo/keto reductase [Fusibacter sp. JL298sf-3]
MKTRLIGKTGIEASVLGFGCMRLPIVDGDSSKIDAPEAIALIRHAIDSGVTYIDTAYPYHGGTSEALVGKALKDGYRERVTLVTKSPSWLHKAPEDFEKYLDEQLANLETDCIDIYLLHALNRKYWETYKSMDVFKHIEKAKADGKIKHIGFSFHDDYPLFEEIVDSYNWDVCMIQLNYMDTEEQAGLKGLAYAEEKGIPVIVMEPLKGGMLATPSEDIAEMWQDAQMTMSPVEWALSYVANFENVKVILSGMSNREQLEENLAIGNRLAVGRLDSDALAVVAQVKAAYDSKVQVKCTQCEYCMPCPHGVEIPRAFTYFNRAHIFNAHDAIRKQYHTAFKPESMAGQCVACGACEPKCPQKIEIIENLKRVAAAFE